MGAFDPNIIIITFNRNSDSYHVFVESYTRTEGVTLLDSRLVSSDPRDLSDLNLVKYARKQVLGNLNPYLEESSIVSQSDYLDNVIEGYTIDGRLVCIPIKF